MSSKDSFKKSLAELFLTNDLETSIRTLHSAFEQHLPVDFITILLYDIKQNTLLHRAHSTNVGIILVDELIKVSDDERREILNRMNFNERLMYIPDGQKDPLVRSIDSRIGIEQSASILLYWIEIAPDQFMALAVVKWGANRYNSKNRHIMKDIFEVLDSTAHHIYSLLVIAQLRQRLVTSNLEQTKSMLRNPIGSANGLSHVFANIERISKFETPVLLCGETGVGKELIANAIHRSSRRGGGPIISINCGAITESLLTSELFGHEKGAFTGANIDKKGYFEQANGGTIFLDEISELSRQAQVMLLRILQEKKFQRVGGQKDILADVRVIAATNRDIEKMVKNKEFREDLWFRFNTFPIKIPALRERKQDIPALAEHFARSLSVEMNLPYQYRFAQDAMEHLMRYNWPGNVRELKNVIENALIVSRGAPMSFVHLASGSTEKQTTSVLAHDPQVLTLNQVITRHIIETLTLTNGRIEGKNGAAELLNINPSTLRAKIKKLGIQAYYRS